MTQTLKAHLSVLAVTAGIAGCAGPEPTRADLDLDTDTAPLVGRLVMQERVVDLTVNAFADAPSGTGVVPVSSTAKVIADIDLRVAPGAETPGPQVRPDADTDDRDRRDLRRRR